MDRYTPPPINRLPLGLLSFLGIKNGGRNPQFLSDQLSPTFELLAWYLQSNAESVSTNGNVAAVGFNFGASFVVPVGETWAVLGTQVNSQAALGAGVTLGVFGAFIPSSLQILPTPLTPIGTSYAPGAVAVAAGTGVQLVPPGGVIGIYCHTLVAGPVPSTLTLRFVRMLL